MDNQHILAWYSKIMGQFLQRWPTAIHKRHGLGQENVDIFNEATPKMVSNLVLLNERLKSSAILSATRNPALCRVSSYLFPGLPSPTTNLSLFAGILSMRYFSSSGLASGLASPSAASPSAPSSPSSSSSSSSSTSSSSTFGLSTVTTV